MGHFGTVVASKAQGWFGVARSSGLCVRGRRAILGGSSRRGRQEEEEVHDTILAKIVSWSRRAGTRVRRGQARLECSGETGSEKGPEMITARRVEAYEDLQQEQHPK